LWVSPKRGFELLNLLQYHMALALAPRASLHGVFMEIFSIGVLITGEAGAGKSELALELISRGHRLVADDAPEFTQIAPDVLDGTCPEMLQDRLTGETPAPSRVLDLDVPVFQLPVAAGRNLAVLTEAAVRLHMLRAKGLDPAAAFLARHAQLLSTSQL
jgi:HPr kinase/phosphorylase